MSISIAPFMPNAQLFFQGLPIPGSEFELWIEGSKRTCSAKSHPPSVDIQHCTTQEIEIRVLLYAGYSAAQLGMVIQSFAGRRGRNFTPAQVEASRRFQEANLLLSQSDQSLEDDRLLLAYFDIFNNAFFFGALKFCKLRYESGEEGILGSCAGGGEDPEERIYIPNNYGCLILISPLIGKVSNRELRLQEYVETLLHEMLHAWFSLFTCRCTSCNEATDITLGDSGHADGWQLASLAIEKASGPLLGICLNIGRDDGMSSEYGGNWSDTLSNERLEDLGHRLPSRCGSCALWRPAYLYQVDQGDLL